MVLIIILLGNEAAESLINNEKCLFLFYLHKEHVSIHWLFNSFVVFIPFLAFLSFMNTMTVR